MLSKIGIKIHISNYYMSLCSGYTDRTNQKQHLFTALLQECQLASPSSR